MRSNLLSFGVLFLNGKFSNLRYIITLYEYVGTTVPVVVFFYFSSKSSSKSPAKSPAKSITPSHCHSRSRTDTTEPFYTVYSLLPQSKEGREKTSKPVCGGGEGERLA